MKGLTLLYEDLTRKILEACFEVSNELGMDVGLLVNFGTPKIEYRRLERKDRARDKGEASAI